MSYPDPPQSGDEKTTLVEFLNYNREVMIDKARGLTKEQLATRVADSSLTIPGLIYHLAIVEEDWFVSDFVGDDLGEPWSEVDWNADPDWEFDVAPTLEPDEYIGAYRAAIERANEIVEAAESLDQLSVKKHPRTGEPWSLRWILTHMIEETARHAGHADIIREAIDGQTGDWVDLES